MSQLLLDAAGRRRSPATMPGFHAGRPPRNKGRRYPADPPTIEEIVAAMRHAGNSPHGHHLRGLIVVLWRAGLRIHETLLLNESDLDRQTRGRARSNTAVRAQLRQVAAKAGVRRRFAPHQLRHAHAVEMAREGVPLIVIQRQLGHTSLGVTSIYLQGIDSAEIIDAVHARRAPMIPVDASLRLQARHPVIVHRGSAGTSTRRHSERPVRRRFTRSRQGPHRSRRRQQRPTARAFVGYHALTLLHASSIPGG
jgi:integrase/recombinase XerD